MVHMFHWPFNINLHYLHKISIVIFSTDFDRERTDCYKVFWMCIISLMFYTVMSTHSQESTSVSLLPAHTKPFLTKLLNY